MTAERSDERIYLRVLAPLLLATLTLAVVSVGGFNALSSARAFVGGESLWSKARSQTVNRLRARASGTLANCAPLDEWLAVPLGDQAARDELDKPEPDLAAARAGFQRGGNLPGDIDGMIRMYRHFGQSSLMRDSVAAWRHGDALIQRLHTLGERICARGPGDTDAAQMQDNLQALDRLDADLADLERRFSSSLGDASRRTAALLTLATVLIAVLLAVGSTWFVLRSLRAQLAQRRALLDANQRWELAADAADFGVFAWHPDQNVVELDARARRFYGFSPDADRPLLRREVLARIHPDDRERMQELGNAAIAAGELLRARHRIIADGAIRHIDVIGMLRDTDAAGLRGQMFGVMRDVTDEVAAGRLQLEKEAAERSAQARSEFLSRLSHELRTPLNAVLGLAQVLAIDDTDPLTERQRQRVQFILDSGWHLLHLVDDVLDITGIDSGLVAMKAEPTDLRAAARASLNLIEPERARLDIVVVEHWPTEPMLAVADAQRLQQVFANLLSNACKYNRHGGTVTLGCRSDGDGQVCVSIADEGRGIAAEELATLFQPFKRLAQTADIPGTGLGLVVVRLLVEQMNGRIEVASEPGHGACFSVWLRKA